MNFDADDLLAAYRLGVFPMSESRDEEDFHFVEPRLRGVMPLDGFHLPARLARTVRQGRFEVTLNTAFEAVLDACAASSPGREDTWISRPIRRLYLDLHGREDAHSIECKREGLLVGGLYGVAIGGAFFGESMFSKPALGGTDASKVALAHLVARLKAGGFALLDMQFMTDHLAQFGAEEIAQDLYLKRLKAALSLKGNLYALGATPTGADVLQEISHRS